MDLALFSYLAVTTLIQITMSKSTHFIGQPLYSQVINLLDKAKNLQISREHGGEHYTKRFTVWVHLVVMLYAVIKRFDSLREITTSLLADTNKLAHRLASIDKPCTIGCNTSCPRTSGTIRNTIRSRYCNGSQHRKATLWIFRLGAE